MTFKMRNNISLLAIVLAGATTAVAQAPGMLSGVVKDAKGVPIAGARISVESPALFAARVVIADAKGVYRVPMLPVGSFKVTASHEGYISSKAEGIRVGLGASISQDLILKTMAVQSAVVEVMGSAAGDIDKSATTVATNFSAEQLTVIPGADRSFAGAADLAAGVVTGANGMSSVRGGTTQSTLYRVNGTDVKDDYQGAQVGQQVLEDNIADVQVVTSPLHARNGRSTSGQVNVVTKSGGNDFEGSIRASFARSSWSANSPATLYREGETNDTLNRNFQVVLSGPIVKDRLWFSFGTLLTPKSADSLAIATQNPDANRIQRTGIAAIDALTATNADLSPAAGSAIPKGYSLSLFDNMATYVREAESGYYEGKLTGAIFDGHSVDVSFMKSTDTIYNRNPGAPIRRLASLGTQKSEAKTIGMSYRGILNSSTCLEARFNRYESSTKFPTGDPNFGTGEAVDIWMDQRVGSQAYLNIGYPFGIGITPDPDKRNNKSYSANLKMFREFFTGTHELDFGFDSYSFDRTTVLSSGLKNAYYRAGGALTNGTDWLFPAIIWEGPGVNGQSGSGNTGLAPMTFQYLGKDGVTTNATLGIYANDAWTINNHWNVMLGLRWDKISVTDTTPSHPTLASASDFSPRLQVKYDLHGDSKHVFSLTAARLGGDFSAGFTDAFVTKADSRYIQAGFSGIPGQLAVSDPNVASDPLHGVRFLTYAQLTNPAYYKNVYNYGDTSKSFVIDGNLTAPYLIEYTLGYTRIWDTGAKLQLTYVNRNWKRDWAFSQDYAADQFVTVTDPSGTGLPSREVQTTHIFNSNELTRKFNSLEVDFSGKLNSTWSIGGNYTYSHLIGNNNGGDGVSSFRENGVPGYYGNRQWLLSQGLTNADFAAEGPLLNNQEHRARIYAAAVMPLGKGKISYSWLLRYDSNGNWSAVYAAPMGLTQIGDPTPPTTYGQYYGGRGQYGYNDSYQVDFKIAFEVPLGIARTKIFGDIQINNLFNSLVRTSYSTAFAPNASGYNQLYLDTQKFGKTDLGTGANYWVSPRSMGMSLGLRF